MGHNLETFLHTPTLRAKTSVMDSYLNQLLRDIASAGSEFEHLPPPETTAEFLELFLKDMEMLTSPALPESTMGDYLGMDKIEFPDPELLTEAQCNAVVDALITAFGKFHVKLDMPEDAPPRSKYRALCRALDQPVATTRLGTTYIETCPIPFLGYCPYGMQKCRCYMNWRDSIIAFLKHPKSENLGSKHDLELFNILIEIPDCLKFLKTTTTPLRESVMEIYEKLHRAWIHLNAEGFTIWYNPEENDIPIHPGRTLLEWTGQSAAVFPEYHELHPKEARLLTCAMLLFVDEYHILPQAVLLEPEKCYEYMVKHISCELRQGTFESETTLICTPDQPHIYHKIPVDKKNWILWRTGIGKLF